MTTETKPPARKGPEKKFRGTVSEGPGRTWLFVSEAQKRYFLPKALVTVNADGSVSMTARVAREVGLL